jgi:hypothetical protein
LVLTSSTLNDWSSTTTHFRGCIWLQRSRTPCGLFGSLSTLQMLRSSFRLLGIPPAYTDGRTVVHDTYTSARLGTGGKLLLPDKDFHQHPVDGHFTKETKLARRSNVLRLGEVTRSTTRHRQRSARDGDGVGYRVICRRPRVPLAPAALSRCCLSVLGPFSPNPALSFYGLWFLFFSWHF